MKTRDVALAGLALIVGVTASAASRITPLDRSQAPLPRALAVRAQRGGAPITAAEASGAVAHRYEATGAPSFIWAGSPGLTGRFEQRSVLEATEAQLDAIAGHYGASSAAALGLSVVSVGTDEVGSHVVTLEQRVGGLPVFRGQLRALLDRRKDLVAVSGMVVPLDALGMAKHGGTAQRSAAEAVATAHADVSGTRLEPSLLASAKKADAHGYQWVSPATFARPLEPALRQPARARMVLFPVDGALVPAWYTEVSVAQEDGEGTVMVSHVSSAVDGELLFRHDLAAHQSYGYRVWADASAPFTPAVGPQGPDASPYPGSAPGDLVVASVPSTLVHLAHAPFSRTDPWLPADATTTAGNNVVAYADITAPDGFNPGDLAPALSAPATFDFDHDFAREPSADALQRSGAVVQLFFVNNWLHDWFYDAGFAEADGNAQRSNFGRGGLEGDPLLAEAHDHSGSNNANMHTPADGASPRMQMFLYDPPFPGRLSVSSPASVAASYRVGGANFGAQVFDVSAALGTPGSDIGRLGCAPLQGADAAAVAGRIALLRRGGGCPFVRKVLHAQQAGAVGALIAFTVPGQPAGSITTDGSATADIPTLTVSFDDANALWAALDSGPVQGRMVRSADLPKRDSSMDTSIVAHEWGHYLSNRLIGNASGLTNVQGRSMGEGWGDFVALLVSVRAEDANKASNPEWSGTYPVATWASQGLGENADYFGIRRIPYSTDMQRRNALTFGHVVDGAALPAHHPVRPNGHPNSEVHNAGEVWATALWECYAGLLRAAPRLDFNEAQRRMKSYLVTGLKLTPSAPTFLEARDALLAAIRAQDPADFDICTQGFARRGFGLMAVAAGRNSSNNSGVIQSFETGSRVQWGSASVEEGAIDGTCDLDGWVDEGEGGRLRVTLQNVGWKATNEVTIEISAADPGIVLEGAGQRLLPEIAPGASATATFDFRLEGVVDLDVPLSMQVTYRDAGSVDPAARSTTVSFQANREDRTERAFVETAEAPDTIATGRPWTFTRAPDSLVGNFVVSAQAHGNHAFFARGPASRGELGLVSPPIHVGSEDFVVTFKHLFDFEVSDGGNWDGAVVEVSSDDGVTWSRIPASAIGPSGAPRGIIATGAQNPLEGREAFIGRSSGWPDTFTDERLDFGTTLAGQTVRLRFSFGADSSGSSGGWLIDDVTLHGATQAPFSALLDEDGSCLVRPTARAGEDQTVLEGAAVTLQGGGEVAAGASPGFSWTQVSGPPVTFEDLGGGKLGFTAPQVEEAGATVVFELIVHDGTFDSAPDAVAVTVLNVAPVSPEPEPGVSGCGCTSGTSGVALPALLLLLGGVGRRRRER